MGGSLSSDTAGADFKNLTNKGNISGNSYVGGLFGGFRNGAVDGGTYENNKVTIEGCDSTGTVTGESDFGDIIGLDEMHYAAERSGVRREYIGKKPRATRRGVRAGSEDTAGKHGASGTRGGVQAGSKAAAGCGRLLRQPAGEPTARQGGRHTARTGASKPHVPTVQKTNKDKTSLFAAFKSKNLPKIAAQGLLFGIYWTENKFFWFFSIFSSGGGCFLEYIVV